MKKIEYDENQVLEWDKKYSPSVVVEKMTKEFGFTEWTAKKHITRIRNTNGTNKRRFYNNKDKSVLIDCIKNNNLNLKKGFREASFKLNRTPEALQAYYYNKLRYEIDLFASVGKQKAINTKNVSQGRQIPEGLSLTGKIFRILKTLI